MIVGDVIRMMTVAKKIVERLVIWEMLDCRQLEPGQAHVVRIKVDRHNSLGLVYQVIENIATTAGDGEEAGIWSELKRFGINPRIFPDLVVNKASKPEREHSLKNTTSASEPMVVYCFLEMSFSAWSWDNAGHVMTEPGD